MLEMRTNCISLRLILSQGNNTNITINAGPVTWTHVKSSVSQNNLDLDQLNFGKLQTLIRHNSFRLLKPKPVTPKQKKGCDYQIYGDRGFGDGRAIRDTLVQPPHIIINGGLP